MSGSKAVSATGISARFTRCGGRFLQWRGGSALLFGVIGGGSSAACLESGLTHPLATLIVVKMCKRRLRSYLRALKSPGRTLSRSTPASRAYGRAKRTLGITSTSKDHVHLPSRPPPGFDPIRAAHLQYQYKN